MSFDKAIQVLENFEGSSLTGNLSVIENNIIGADSKSVLKVCNELNINQEFMSSALAIKKLVGQINVIIHASGIIHSLPKLLEEDEVVESVSLGAGNTGRKFDLETNLRVAEFKFIDWKGGSESIRQNSVFKDFFELAEDTTTKRKYLYVVDPRLPLKFLNGGRALTSVLEKQPLILEAIIEKYGNKVKVVRDYFLLHKEKVSVYDIRPCIGREL